MRHPRKYVSPKTGHVSWRVRYRGADGGEHSETFYEEDLADEFARLLHALGPARALAYIDKREKEEGGARTSPITVADLWTRWRDWKGAVNKHGDPIRVRNPRTLTDYDRMWRSRIAPEFGHMPANLVGQVDVQEWIDKLSAEIEPKTIADYHSLLHGLYLWGVHPSVALVVNDPCVDTRLPMRKKKQPKGLRPDEWHILHRAAREVDPDVADLLLFMASTGWRWSECVAVQALAVDHWLEDGRPRTFVTMGRVLRREGSTFAFVDDAKSAAGERRIELVGAGAEMVLRRIAGRPPEALVFTTKSGGRWRYEHFYRRYWTRPKSNDDAPNRERILEAAARLGLNRPGLTPHWTRHTHVGMLILAGEPLTAIQKRLGHASIKTTSDVYGRMIEDASAAGLDRVAALLSGQPVPEVEG